MFGRILSTFGCRFAVSADDLANPQVVVSVFNSAVFYVKLIAHVRILHHVDTTSRLI
jgi:hypothetical protein